MEKLHVPQGEFNLKRYPDRKNEQLRAWDAADEYLLNYIHVEHKYDENVNILLVNDSFGALAVSLHDCKSTNWSDSYLAQQGTKSNFSENNLPIENVKLLTSLNSPQGYFDLVLIKIPKSLALLEEQLIRIKPVTTPGTTIIAAGMVKSIHTSTLKLFEKYIGETHTSLAKKKARLIFVKNDPSIKAIQSPYPESYILENTGLKILNHANVFSRASLDIGTRFFLQHIPTDNKIETIIDLGCGNGVVGLLAGDKNPLAELIFVDESYMAVASAKENFRSNLGKERKAGFIATDCLSGIEENSADLILNNPPFHQNSAVGDAVAWQMFNQAKKVLKPGGELRVIGNRHLGYHIKLKKIFNNCEVIASNKKFVILSAVKNTE